MRWDEMGGGGFESPLFNRGSQHGASALSLFSFGFGFMIPLCDISM